MGGFFKKSSKDKERNKTMAKLKILKKNAAGLRCPSRPVTEITPRILTLLDDMAETMYDADGCGLAAPQIGVLRRVVVLDVGDGLVELINPKIIATEGEQCESEGCLSVPGEWGITRRPAKVTVRAQDRHGEWFEMTGEGLLARCFCHEIDHLDGKLFIDKGIMIERLERD